VAPIVLDSSSKWIYSSPKIDRITIVRIDIFPKTFSA
jgi:hypothetical protein